METRQPRFPSGRNARILETVIVLAAVVVAIKKQLGLPVRFIGIGDQLEDLGLFDAEAYVEALFA